MLQDLTLSNFTAGELSPRMKGRVDVSKYYNGCETLLNFVVMPQGGVTRRPGTMYVVAAANQASASRLIPFVFSTVQAYQIEFSDGTARFYMNDGQIASGGSPVALSIPYAAAELAALGYAQSQDTLFLCHPSYATRSLTRSSHTIWSIQTLTFRDGPYLPVNVTTTTLNISGRTGTITVTASSSVGINATPSNAGQGFLATDVGRPLRMRFNGVWCWTIIQTVVSPTQVTAAVQDTVPNGAYGPITGAAWPASVAVVAGWICQNGGNYYICTKAGTTGASGGPTGTATTPVTDGSAQWTYTSLGIESYTWQWQLGKWGPTTGYPYQPMFWQNRLVLAGTNNQPNAVEASVTGDFTNFAPTQADGTVTGINALSWTISDDQVNAIRWLSPAGSAQAQQLGIGTSGGEEIMQAASTTQALEPTNVQTYRETSLGSSPSFRPVRIGKSVLFFNRPGRKLHEWTFQWTVNGYLGPDLAVLAEHITGGANAAGVVFGAYQQSPYSVLWCYRADGALIGLTYLREQDVVAWHEHQLGGDYYGGPPVVESVSCNPSPDGSYDELWLQVLRTINGVATRTIEVMTRYFDGMLPEAGFFVDCGLSSTLTYPAGTVTPVGFPEAAPPTKPPSYSGSGTLAISGGSFASGNVASIVRLNGGVLVITGYTDSGHVTAQTLAPMRNLAPAASGAWTLNAPATTASGLGHLNGETVAVLGDGQVFPQQAVSGGAVSLAPGASWITAGLPYTSELVSMPWESARAAASAQGRLKRIHALFLRFFETVGGAFGLRTLDGMTWLEQDNTEQIWSRSAANPMGQALPLFSGVQRLRPTGGSDREGRIIVTQSDPLPCTVLSIGAQADVEEIGQP